MQTNRSTSAGKLHLLDIAEVKARLGSKWARLAEHVEMFLEAAIRRNLGPGDTSLRIDELSWLVVFKDLSLDEAHLKCQVISEEVCERLFGEQGLCGTMRNLVAHVSLDAMPNNIQAARVWDELLEREGRETIVSRGAPDDARNERSSANGSTTVVDCTSHRAPPADPREYLYRPIWDVTKQAVVTYLCQPAPQPQAMPENLAKVEENNALLDVQTLEECTAHAAHLLDDGFRIASCVPVSFSTLSRSKLWMPYAKLLRGISRGVARDLAFMVTDIHWGVPNLRLGQELPRLAIAANRIYCLIDNASGAGSRFAQTGAQAIGLAISEGDPELVSFDRIETLGDESRKAGLDAFVLGIRSTSVALHAIGAGMRFLEGPAVRQPCADPRHAFSQSLDYLYAAKSASAAVS